MGITTHCELCEYLLLRVHPDGLKKSEFVPELFKRGWSDEYNKNVAISSKKKYLDELKEIYEHAFRNVKEKDGTLRGDLSWVAGNVAFFCSRHEAGTENLLEAKKNKDEEMVKFHEGDGSRGRIYFNLDGNGKFKFYPGSAGTPHAWTYHLDLLHVAADLADDEVWAASRKSEIGARIDTHLSIARWFSKKFDRDFYDICLEEYEIQKKSRFHIGPPNPKIKNLGKLEGVATF